MPIFRYSCKNCGHEYETLIRSSLEKDREEEEKNEACPRCASRAKERLVNTGTSFQLKGRGWARDRYGNGK